MQALGGASDMVFGQQGIEREQKIEVDMPQEIIHPYTSNFRN